MNLFYQSGIGDGIHHLDAEESRHAVRVLRMNKGDLLTLTDGKGFFYSAKITRADSKKCEFEMLTKNQMAKRNFQIHIGIAPTKNSDRMEWFAEKATEMGVDEISFIRCHNSERKTLDLKRIEKIVVNAMKQSQQAWLPKLNSMISFDEMLNATADQKFIAQVDESNPKHLQSAADSKKRYLTLIGPEGDFTKEEVAQALQQGYEKVSLGANRLRTETAALVAVQTLILVNG